MVEIGVLLQSSGEGKGAVNWSCSQAATSNSEFTKAAWATMSSPSIPFTCPFLIIAKVSYPTRVCHAVRNLLKKAGPDQPFYPTAILLHDVTQALSLAQLGETPEPLIPPHVSHALGQVAFLPTVILPYSVGSTPS